MRDTRRRRRAISMPSTPLWRRSRLCSLVGRRRQQGELHRSPAFRPALSRDEAERRESPRLRLPCDHHRKGRLRSDAEWAGQQPTLVVHRRLGEARSKCAVCLMGIHTHSQAIRGATQLELEQSPVTKPVWSPYVDPSIMAGLDDADMPPRRLVGAIGVCELPLSRPAIIGGDEPASQTQEEVPHVSTRTL